MADWQCSLWTMPRRSLSWAQPLSGLALPCGILHIELVSVLDATAHNEVPCHAFWLVIVKTGPLEALMVE